MATKEPTVGEVSPAARLSALQSWRENVLRGMLTVAAIVAPVVVAISLALLPGTPSWPRIGSLIAAGVGFPLLRFTPGLSVALRAWLVICLLYGAGVVGLINVGFATGPGVLLAGTSVLAAVFLGRVRGLMFIGLCVIAFFVVGSLAVRGGLMIRGVDLDPTRMRNWTRTGINFGLLTLLLTTAIDFVIRHVEASSRAAATALTDLSAAYARLAHLHERFDAAKEEERRFIAHELHDELGQVLTVVKLRLATGDSRSNAETITLVDDMIGRVRKISSDLRPPLLDEIGLFPALRAHVEAQSALSGVAIDLETEGDGAGRLDAGQEIACFRVVQESLTNALRHASPRHIRVRAIRRPTALSLSIVDDGAGFDTATLGAAGGHLGVVGMQERIRARGGSLRISSRPGAGTSVDVEIPLEP